MKQKYIEDTMITDILWRFLILVTFVVGALGNCHDDHPQKQFCTSEFVLKAKLHKGTHLKGGYRMEILTVFKGDPKNLNIKHNRYVDLETSNTLDGDKYLIFGRSKNGRLYSDSCKENMQWLSANRFYTRALVTLYKTSCDCIDKIGNYSSDKRCHWLFSFMRKFGKKCTWVKTSHFKYCQKGGRTSWH